MSSKVTLSPVPAGPVLARRVVPVVVAATLLTGCGGDPGAPSTDAGVPAADSTQPGIVAVDVGIVAADAGPPTDDAGR